MTPELDNWFEHTFWAMYPRKVEKKAARAAIAKLNPDDDLCAQIMSGLERALKYNRNFRERRTDYIAYPATWINGERWTDEYDTTAPVQLERASPAQRKIPGVGGHKLPPDANLRELFPYDDDITVEQWESELQELQRMYGGVI